MSALHRNVTVLLAALASFIVMAEVDRLIADTLVAGQGFSLADVLGPLAVAHTDAWNIWVAAPSDFVVFVVTYALFGVVLLFAFVGVGLRLFRRSPLAASLLIAHVGFYAVESALVFTGLGLASATGPVFTVLPVVSSAKWLTLAGAVVAGIQSRDVRAELKPRLARLWHALYAQRLPLIVLVGLGALGIVPRSGVLEQLPDVQRGWLDEGGGIHLVFAFASIALLSLTLFVIGRRRAERTFRTFVASEAPTVESSIWWWLTGPIAAMVVLGLFSVTGRTDLVDLPTLGAFVVILTGILIASFVIRQIAEWRRVDLWMPDLPAPSRTRFTDVRIAGDVVAGLLLAVAGLGLVRSFAAPFVLALALEEFSWLHLGLLVLGAVMTFGALPALGWVAGRIDRAASRSLNRSGTSVFTRAVLPTDYTPTPTRARFAAVVPIFVAGAGFLAWATLDPRGVSGTLGSAATATLAFGAWAAVIGVGVSEMQNTKPLALFRLVHLRSNPVLALLVIVPIVIAQFGGSPPLHALQKTPSDVNEADRLSLAGAFSEWYSASSDCRSTVTVDGVEVAYRPMVLAAAEGGGIRASTWTVDVFSELAAAGPCARNAVLLSSGASGGSVGLTLFRDAPDATDVVDRVAALGDGDALAAVITGTFVGDLIAGTTGLRVPSARVFEPGGDPVYEWQDRAALMQDEWREKVPELYAPYDLDRQSPTGWLVLNSTTINPNCKVLVSQLDLGLPSSVATDAKPSQGSPDCRNGTAELPGSIDLVEAYRDCPTNLDWATAMMLSARFPFVTPAGRLAPSTAGPSPECAAVPDLQLIDGGYYDNSGLGTISDLAPELASIIAAHNATAVETGEELVIPVVAYIRNSAGSDVAAPAPTITPELLVPLSGFGTKDLQLEPGTWLQRISNTFASVCPADPLGSPTASERLAQVQCRDALRAVRADLGFGVAVIAPNTAPSLEGPLGWQLSDVSRALLCDKLVAQWEVVDGPPRPYGALPELVALLEPSAKAPTEATAVCAR